MGRHTRVVISGIGETEPSRGQPVCSGLALQLQAALRAIDDAGLAPREIDGIIAMQGGPAVAEDFITNFGLPDLRFSGTTPMGGASSVAAIQCAQAVIAAGVCRHVLIPVGRNSRGPEAAPLAQRLVQLPQYRVSSEFELPLGVLAPVQHYAAMAQRHMAVYGTTSEDLGHIAVSTRQHAMRNERALFRTPITLADHQSSRMVADPLRVLDCCMESNGGAAVVISDRVAVPDLRHPAVQVLAVAEGHPDSPSVVSQRADLTTLGLAKAAARAFAEAGVTHADIDVAALYDCFTYIVLCQLEDLGFCAKGEGGAFVRAGHLAPGGRLPTNTHGGLLSHSHMLGMGHVIEIVRQLRHQANNAQVPNARVGLVTGYGDFGDGAVAILGR